MRSQPLVALTNHSTVVSDAEIANMVDALQAQVSLDFGPLWNAHADIEFMKMTAVPKDAWVLGIFDTSDQAGALGYHDVTAHGLPLGKVFAADDKKYGASLSVTISHELLELLADPFIATAIQVTKDEFIALEVCDAVEDDALGYERPGKDGKPVLLSDFITPKWFDNLTSYTGEGFDFKKHLKRSLTLAKGGYVSVYVSGQGWTQKQARLADTSVHEADVAVGKAEQRSGHFFGSRGSQRCLRGRVR